MDLKEEHFSVLKAGNKGNGGYTEFKQIQGVRYIVSEGALA